MRHGEFTLWAALPPGASDLTLLRESAGLARPLIDLRSHPSADARTLVEQAAHDGLAGLTVITDARDHALIDFLREALPRGSRVILSRSAAVDADMGGVIAGLRDRGLAVGIEVADRAGASAVADNADFLVVSGNEAGGSVSPKTTLILLQELLEGLEVPLVVRGSLGPQGAAAAAAAGCAGCILDTQLLLAAESPLSADLKQSLLAVSPLDTTVVGDLVGRPYRLLRRGDPRPFRALVDLEKQILLRGGPPQDGAAEFESAVEEHLRAGFSSGAVVLAVGQGIAFAQRFAEAGLRVGEILDRYHLAVRESIARVKERYPFSPHSPLAQRHAAKFPFVLGPMARISDRAAFAAEVAAEGALPFVAVGGLSPEATRRVVTEAKAALGDRPFGVGLIAFSPIERVAEQIDVVLAGRPTYVTVAGGNPDLARRFEEAGIGVYLHAPSPTHVSDFLDHNVQGIILEGHEAGGHVGSLGSLVLWELGVLEVLARRRADVASLRVLLAGGVATARGALAAAALGSPLVDHGVAYGLQLGTAYLMTDAAVRTGAIAASYSQALLDGTDTIVLGRTANLPARWLLSDEVRNMAADELEWEQQGLPLRDRKKRVEGLNLGHLQVAARGGADEVPPDTQAHAVEGVVHSTDAPAFMCGQGISAVSQAQTIGQLHEELAARAVDLATALTVPGASPSPEETGDGLEDAVAIIGLGCIFPGADNPGQFWHNILNRVSAVTEIPEERWDLDPFYDPDPDARDKTSSKLGAFIKGFKKDPIKFRIPPIAAKSIDRIQFIALEVAYQAMIDAGYPERELPREKAGVILGNSSGGDLSIKYCLRGHAPYVSEAVRQSQAFGALPEDVRETLLGQVEQAFRDQFPEYTEDSCPGVLGSVIAGRVAHFFDLGGPAFTLDGACASSLVAVNIAVEGLRNGQYDMALVGGVDTRVDPDTYILFSHLGAISNRGSFPFDERADGFILAEGAGMIVLKRWTDARRDGDKVYALIRSVGSAGDGRAGSITVPDVHGQVRALERAYEGLPFSPDAVTLIEAHGTGTPVGDRAELESLTRFFRRYTDARQTVALGSVKSMVGHLKSAAGIAGVIKAALALHHRTLPPTMNCEQPRRGVNWDELPFYLNTEPRSWDRSDGPRRAGIDSFGFGGINFHVVMEEAPTAGAAEPPAARPRTEAARPPAELLIFRAPTREALLQPVAETRNALRQAPAPDLSDVAAGLWGRASPTGATLAVVAANAEECLALLDRAQGVLSDGSRAEYTSAQGIYFGEKPIAPDEKVAFLFPGQGSQYVNMVGDLADCFPFVRGVLRDVDAIVQGVAGAPMAHTILCEEGLTAEERARRTDLLFRTDYNHPALLAVGMVISRCLERAGVRPAMAAGHSVGEYCALHAAGAFDMRAAVTLITARGSRIHERSFQQGAMATVGAPAEDVQAVLKDASGFVTVANFNCPAQTVISGDVEAVEEALARFEEMDIHCGRLPVSGAFHTPIMSPCVETFRQFLDQVPVQVPKIPVFANLTGRAYEVGDDFPRYLRDRLATHMIRPVEFIKSVESMYAGGARLFLEVGPGSTLCSFVDNILADRAHWAFPTNMSQRSATLQLLHALAFCAARGLAVDLEALVPVRKHAWGEAVGTALSLVRRPASVPGRTVPRAAPAAGPSDLVRSALAGQDAGTVDAYVRQRAEFLKNMVQLDYRHFTEEQTPAAAPATPVSVEEDIRAQVVDLVARKTGYPADVIDLDLDVEAELGLDSIKQVEIVRELETDLGVELADAGGQARRYTISTLRELIGRLIVLLPDVAPDRAPQAAPAPATAVAAPGDTIREQVVEVVARKTGYPPDVIDLDLDVEAELGLDSIKQVEIVRELETDLGVELADGLQARRYTITTLRELIDRLSGLLPERSEGAVAAVAEAPSPAEQPGDDWNFDCRRWVSELVEQPLEGLPLPDALRDRKVLLLADDGSPGVLLADRLRETGAQVTVLGMSDSPGRAPAECDVLLNFWSFTEDEAPAPALPQTSDWWADAERAASALLDVARPLGRSIKADENRRVLWVNVTALGGELGARAIDRVPVARSGIGLGLTRCLRAELRDALDVIYLDFDPSESDDRVADSVMAELAHGPRLAEVGYRQGKRYAIRWHIDDAPSAEQPARLDAESVVLAVGGARGITALICRQLAGEAPARFVIVGRSVPPEIGDEPPAAPPTFLEAREALLAEHRNRGDRVVPAEINRLAWQRVWAADRAVNLHALRAVAGQVVYRQCDITDPQAVGRLIQDVAGEYGRIDLVIQGGGVLVEKSVVDFSAEEFIGGMKPKALGTACLLAALSDVEVGTFINLASIAGRWGNMGQSCYAAGHEIAAALVAAARSRRPGRWINVLYGPWLNVGVVRTGAIKQRLHERNTAFVTEQTGTRFLADEFRFGPGWNIAFCGDEPSRTFLREPAEAAAPDTSIPPLLDRFERVAPGAVEGHRVIDISRDRFVGEHIVAYESILPGTIALELMAQTASLLTDRSLQLTDAAEFELARAVRFPRGEPREVHIRARRLPDEEGGPWIATELFTLFTPPGSDVPEETVHARCRVRFGVRQPPPKPSMVLVNSGLGDCRVDVSPLWQTRALNQRFGIFRNVRSVLSLTPDAAVGEVLATHLPEVGDPPLTDNPIRLDGESFFIDFLTAIHHGNSSYYVKGVDAITFYESDGLETARICHSKMMDYAGDSITMDIEAIGSMGRVRERMTGLHKHASLPGNAAELPEQIWADLRENPQVGTIRRLLDHKGDLALANVRISLVEGALDAGREEEVLREFLSAAERERYSGLTHPKRRLEWLAGRIAAKGALRLLGGLESPLPNAVTVASDHDNAPRAIIDGEPAALCISIAHSGDMAIAGASSVGRLGLDVEEIDRSIRGIADDFCRPEEVVKVLECPGLTRLLALMYIWTAKEAVRKIVGPGTCTMSDVLVSRARPDGDYVVCEIDPPGAGSVRAVTFQSGRFVYAVSLMPERAE